MTTQKSASGGWCRGHDDEEYQNPRALDLIESDLVAAAVIEAGGAAAFVVGHLLRDFRRSLNSRDVGRRKLRLSAQPWIQQRDAERGKVLRVSRHQSEAMLQRRRRDHAIHNRQCHALLAGGGR